MNPNNPFAQQSNDAVSFLPEDYVAKKSETRRARIDRYAERILDGKGFRDR